MASDPQRRPLNLQKIGKQAQIDSERFRQHQKELNDAEGSVKPSIGWKLKMEPVSLIDHDTEGTRMELNISGKVGNKPTTAMIANMIKHTIMGKEPVYGIGYGSIKINTLDSVFDEHYISRRLCSIPVLGVTPDVLILGEANYPYIKGDCGTMAAIGEYTRHPGDTKEIRLVINVHNHEDDLRRVTTNDFTCYLNDERVELFDKKRPQLIVDLRRNEKFAAQIMPVLGFGDMHNGWAPVQNAYVTGDAGNHNLILNSYGQMPERELVIRGCRLLKLKMRSFIQQLLPLAGAYDTTTIVDLPFKKEGSELAVLLTYILSLDTNVAFQSAVKRHEQIPEFVLHVKTVSGNPVRAVISALATIRDIYADLEAQASKKLPDKPKSVEVLPTIEKLIADAGKAASSRK